jgi:hypothetical protein
VLTESSGQAPEVPVGVVCTRFRVRENCSGFRPEVPIRTGSSGPSTGSSGGPELNDKPNGLISFVSFRFCKKAYSPPSWPIRSFHFHSATFAVLASATVPHSESGGVAVQ